ncbi:MAG: long-chain fatty acid--CoA ligase [Armatimonadetes bacterium]|nr:long-chain fatty acid--CoA ligase [Armatimonadota bacterium]MDW8154373.1 long-chain fatty acid--CoA ligase [Armatimonadota bacterium]
MPEDVSELDETFRKVARDRAGHTAMVYLGERYRFRDLEDLVDRLTRGLERLGVEAGERVLLYMPHCPQWVVTWLALRRRGVVAVPVSPQYGPRDVAYVAQDAGASVLFCADTLFGYAARVQQEVDLRCVVVTGIGDLLPWWKRAVGKALDRLPTGRVRLAGSVFTFQEILAGPTRSRRPGRPSEGVEGPEGLCELLYTGGTLGAVPLGSDTVIQGAPLYHILGQAQGLGALLAGETLVLLPRMNWDAFLDHIQRYRVTTLFGTPTLYRTILEHPRLDAYDLRSLRYCFSAGDALPPELARRWKTRFGLEIHQGYGATEACGAISMTPAGPPFPEGTVGQVVRGREVRIVDPETLRPCSPGEPGELLVSGPNLPTAYWNRPEETQRAFSCTKDACGTEPGTSCAGMRTGGSTPWTGPQTSSRSRATGWHLPGWSPCSRSTLR